MIDGALIFFAAASFAAFWLFVLLVRRSAAVLHVDEKGYLAGISGLLPGRSSRAEADLVLVAFNNLRQWAFADQMRSTWYWHDLQVVNHLRGRSGRIVCDAIDCRVWQPHRDASRHFGGSDTDQPQTRTIVAVARDDLALPRLWVQPHTALVHDDGGGAGSAEWRTYQLDPTVRSHRQVCAGDAADLRLVLCEAVRQLLLQRSGMCLATSGRYVFLLPMHGE